MMPSEAYEGLVAEATAFADKWSAIRVRVNTLDFDYDFKRDEQGVLQLVGLKAVIRVLGRTVKEPIGQDKTYKTYDEAYEATKKHWSEYYRQVRQNRSPAERRAEAKRQRAYRERRQQAETEASRQQ